MILILDTKITQNVSLLEPHLFPITILPVFLLVGLRIRPDGGILIMTVVTSKIHGATSQDTGIILMFKDTWLPVGSL